MKEVFLDHESISNSEINGCIAAFQDLQTMQTPVLKIIARKELRDINILLPAYLILFKTIKPDLDIRVYLQHNSMTDDRNRAPFKLLQYRPMPI
jgi:hypothetical protein